ncbi:DUF47 domain-containing protein [Thermophilibacter immobilis]|jgi:uncharacterized protein Yka (UPF0111/DUF47 family)|uniref:DUF47 family protein n=1 Tax=Thermophilibacter immobilis TaxID=2779519 RepID=A0A7S7RV03_9ACTN|nr:DUF47 family protein [Thermophilibacter immobilis]QOY61098.1 DUF47 family protein [Thermophilibacter immobilis]
MARAKKEDVFYTMLKDFAALITETAEEYTNIIHDFPDSMSRIPQMKVYETTCDERVKAIMEKLYDSFITPFDREDISDLALAMDDVTDAMYGVTMRLDLFNLQDRRIEAEQIADLTLTAVREMQEMIGHLPNYQKDEVVMEKAINVGNIEDQGDTVYQTALRRLFHEDEGLGGKYAVTWLRIFDRMEYCLDACDDVSKIVREVVMKSC